MSSGAGVVRTRPRTQRAAVVAGHSRRSGDGLLGRLTKGTPWGDRDLLNLVVWLLLALGGIAITYWLCSGEVEFHDQVAWISLSVLAVVVAGAAGGLFLFTGLREVARERSALSREIANRYGLTVAASRTETAEPTVVTADGMRRYHLAGCDVVRGKSTRQLTDAEAEKLKPCGMCRS
jgi:hypothetical protein